MCYPDAQKGPVIKKSEWRNKSKGETFTVIAQLARSLPPQMPKIGKKLCSIGCGRECAVDEETGWVYDTCCRTCSWWPETPGAQHGPCCEAKFYAKCDEMSKGGGPSDDDRDPDKPITGGIAQKVPPGPGPYGGDNAKISGTTSKAAPPVAPKKHDHPINQMFQYKAKNYTNVALPPVLCTRIMWNLKPPIINPPQVLMPRTYHSRLLTTGKYKGQTYDWVIRQDQQYCTYLMRMEMEDQLGDELSIFAHYCLETPALAERVPQREYKKTGGINNVIKTTFSGHGQAMKTGAQTLTIFGQMVRRFNEQPNTFKGYQIDPKELKKTISQIADGVVSIDELSWLWNETNMIVTALGEVYYVLPEPE